MGRMILLMTLAIAAVLVAGVLLLNRNNAPTTIVQERRAVIPHQVGQGVREYDYDSTPEGPGSVTPQMPEPNLNNELSKEPHIAATTPAETKIKPSAPETKEQANSGQTTTQSDADSKAAPGTASKTTPAKPAIDKHTFDKNGVFTLKPEMAKNGFRKGEEVVLIVDKGSHFTYVLQKQGDRVVIVHRASNAIGTDDTPSPPGPYKVVDKTKWPSWVPPKSIDPEQKAVHPYNKDRKNPLGVARIRLDKFQVALHGTNDQDSIRTNASHGCIRHSNNDILKIFSMVEKGDTVIITEKFVGTKVSKKMFADS